MNEQNRPSFDADPLVIISHCLRFDPAYTEALAEVLAERLPLPEDDCWDRHDTLTDAVPMAKALRLPHDPKQHQQPHDVGRLLRRLLPIHSDASDCEDETMVNRKLYPLVLASFRKKYDTLPYAQALQQIKESVIELNHFFGCDNRLTREISLGDALEVIEWFADTEGLHDLRSGVVDVGTATVRAFLKGSK